MGFLKKTLPLTIAFVLGVTGVLLNYSPHATSQKLLEEITSWLITIAAFASFMGIFSLINVHFHKMRRRVAGWGYSFFVVLGFVLMLAFGIYNGGSFVLKPMKEDTMIDWMYNYVFNPAQATMFSILAFFIASAAFRSFRAKTTEAALLLIAAVIVMFGQVPIAALVSQIIPDSAQWLLAFPNLAVKRAIYFGVCLGTVATSIRIIFGIERAYLGGK